MDTDQIAVVTHKELAPGSTDTTTTTYDLATDSFEQAIERTFSQTGDYLSILQVEDAFGEIQSDTNTVLVYAELVSRQTTVDMGYPSVNVVAHLDGLQVALGVTGTEGLFTYSQELPKDSLISYDVQADAAGLIAGSYALESSGDQSASLTIDPVPITIAPSLPGQYPRTSDVVALSDYVEAVDPEQGALSPTISLEQDGTAFEVTQSAGDYTFTTDPVSDPAGITASFTLQASHEFLSSSGAITKEIFARRDISFLQTSFQATEKDSLVIEDIRTLLDSQAEITAAIISGADAGLQVVQDSEWRWVITPTEELSNETRNYSFSINAENRDGQAESQAANVAVDALPEFSATVVDHVNELAVSKAYLVVEDANMNTLDSLTALNGVFTGVEIPANAEGFRFGELRNEHPYALEHRIFPMANGNYIVPIGNRDKHDKFKTLIGEHTEDELMRRWADGELICGHAGLEGINASGDFYRLNDELCGWAQENGSLPQKIVIGKFVTTDYFNFSSEQWETRQDSMSQETLDLVLDNFENEYSVSLPGLPQPTIVDTLHYDFRNQEEHALYIVPRSRSGDSRGTIDMWGTKNNDAGTIKHVLVTLRSNSGQDADLESQNKTQDQEFGAVLYEQGRGQAQNLGNYESIVKQGQPNNNAEICPLNLWMGWMTTSDFYKDAPNKNTFTNASIIPKAWNPDYTTLTTACDELFGKECSDEGY